MSAATAGPAFALRGLVKRYPGFTLGPLELELPADRVLGFVGPNGSGKTTTLNCIAGLTVPDAGEVEVFGRRTDPRLTDWKLDIGYAGEEQGFYQGWTVAENLAFLSRFQPRWSAARANDLLRRFALPRERKVRELSRGNRSKLGLVAALAHAPRLLLLDEPTSGLDPVVRSEVLDVLWEVLEDGERAIFYSTHVLPDISRLADELVFLYDGKVLQRSATADLAESWRRISFRLAGSSDADIAGVVARRSVRAEHQVISADHRATLAHLRELGAEAIEASRMTIDEIAVEILKRGTTC